MGFYFLLCERVTFNSINLVLEVWQRQREEVRRKPVHARSVHRRIGADAVSGKQGDEGRNFRRKFGQSNQKVARIFVSEICLVSGFDSSSAAGGRVAAGGKKATKR